MKLEKLREITLALIDVAEAGINLTDGSIVTNAEFQEVRGEDLNRLHDALAKLLES